MVDLSSLFLRQKRREPVEFSRTKFLGSRNYGTRRFNEALVPHTCKQLLGISVHVPIYLGLTPGECGVSFIAGVFFREGFPFRIHSLECLNAAYELCVLQFYVGPPTSASFRHKRRTTVPGLLKLNISADLPHSDRIISTHLLFPMQEPPAP
jgi:hypothetical protein